MKKTLGIILTLLLLSGCTLTQKIQDPVTVGSGENTTNEVVVTNFEECIATGAPVMESYPRQCKYGDNIFVEEVEQTKLGSPASKNCDEKGGTVEIKKGKDGGEYGVCIFEDNKQCEEWALFNGECPDGGVEVSGYETDEQIICAITGGVVDLESNICMTSAGECDLETYGVGACDVVEIIEDNLTYQTIDEVGLKIGYPEENVGYDENGLKDMNLVVSVTNIADMPEEGPMGEDQLTANKDKDALAEGSFGESMVFSVDGSEKVVQLADGTYAKVNATFSMFDVCSTVFKQEALFYVGDTQVAVRLWADEKIAKAENPEYFFQDPDNCGEEMIWNYEADSDLRADFWDALKKGEKKGLAKEWYEAFDVIISSIQAI